MGRVRTGSFEHGHEDCNPVAVVRDAISRFVPLSKKYSVDVTVDFTDEVDRHLVFISIVVDAKYQVGLYI